MCAAGQRVAAIVGAGIAIVAVQYSGSHTSATLADIPGGAGIAIIAGGIIAGEYAIAVLAGLVGAGVTIITRGGRPCLAKSRLTGVIHGAGIAIFTSPVCGLMVASTTRKTNINGAGIAIVAG